jgi:hypothetical protein
VRESRTLGSVRAKAEWLRYSTIALKTNPLANPACPEVGLLAAPSRRHTRSLQHKPGLLRSFIRHSPLSLPLR